MKTTKTGKNVMRAGAKKQMAGKKAVKGAGMGMKATGKKKTVRK